jgi:hypothetical protein
MAHHLILGKIKDYLTGETLPDTLDERFRQKIARFLVEEKGYETSQIAPRRKLTVTAGRQSAVVPLDFVIRLEGRVCMVVRFGPGSMVTRHRPSLAAARLIDGRQVPVVVVTNGKGAEVLDGTSGRRIGEGLSAIPHRNELEKTAAGFRFDPVPRGRAEKEARIVYAFEVDGACPCDDTVCRLDTDGA